MAQGIARILHGARIMPNWKDTSSTASAYYFAQESMTAYCINGPWCEEDVCRCKQWENEQKNLENGKIDTGVNPTYYENNNLPGHDIGSDTSGDFSRDVHNTDEEAGRTFKNGNDWSIDARTARLARSTRMVRESRKDRSGQSKGSRQHAELLQLPI